MKVRATFEMDVDDTWGESEEECIEIAKEEFATDIWGSLVWEVVDKRHYPYPTVGTEGSIISN